MTLGSVCLKKESIGVKSLTDVNGIAGYEHQCKGKDERIFRACK